VTRSTADENSNHNHLIVEENSFTVQLTLVMETAVHQLFHLFCCQNAKFLFTNYVHTCLLIILFFMTFGHSKLVRQQKC